MRKPSAVVDTNLFISALILPKSNPSRLISLWKKNVFTLVTSQAMIEELETVLARPKYETVYGIDPIKMTNLISSIFKHARVLSTLIYPSIKIRDTKDMIVLATALDGEADFLISGDKDLLSLKKEQIPRRLKILTVDQFLKHLEVTSVNRSN